MSVDRFSGQDRRSGTAKIINELLGQRQQVWALYCNMADLKPFTSDQPLAELIEEFCEILVDYIALGHFGIYQRIINGNERRRKVIQVAEEIYPLIAKATDTVVDFNDKYEKLRTDQNALLNQLSNDLSQLGEELATRIELEDQLLETMVA